MKKLLFLAPLLLIAGCNSQSKPAPTSSNTTGKAALKVALITPGDINDKGWNQLAYEGLQGLRNGGAQVSNQVTKSPSDFAPAIRGYGRDYDLVFCHGNEYGDTVKEVAPKFENTKFVVVAGNLKQAPNVASLVPKLEEATYLLGIAAGKMTKTGTIGCLGGMELSVIKSTFDAFEKGAKSVNPKVKVLTKFVGNFEDQNKGKEYARLMIAQGADVMFHNADQAGNGMFVAAQEASKSGKTVYVFGSNRNQNDLAPDVCLASGVIEMPTAFEQIVKSVEAKKFEPKLIELNLKNGTIAVEWNEKLKGKVPAEVVKLMDAAKAKIEAGTLKIERKV